MSFNGKNLKIALQKQGRLAEQSLELLENCGLSFTLSKDQLFATCSNFDLDLLFLRDDDIPEYVQDGVCDLGIVGENIIQERKAAVKGLQRLGFGQCRLSLAVPNKSSIKTLDELSEKKIATSYPVFLRQILKRKCIKAEVIEISGSVEIAPSLDLADAIVDLVSSGNTLKRNGLREIQTLFQSEAVLIQGKKPSNQKKTVLIERLLMRMRSSLQAKESKYILMNAPQSSLEAIKEIIPGLYSPTVVPLADKNMISIQAVVNEQVFWGVIEGLKSAGASGILVLPIEKMIL